MANIVEDTTPQLGGDLDCQSKDIDDAKTITFDTEYDNGNFGDSGVVTSIDWTNGQKQKITLTDNVTVTLNTAPAGPADLTLKVVQDATGSRTITWDAYSGVSIYWAGGSAPTLSTSAEAVDIFEFYYDGSNYYHLSKNIEDTPDCYTAGVSIDGGGSAITTGAKNMITIPKAGTIAEIYMVADVSTSTVVDVWKKAGAVPTDSDSITASDTPTLTTATYVNDTTLTGWTTTVSEGDVIRFNVDSNNNATFLTLVLKIIM